MDVYFWPPLQLLAYARAARRILYSFDSESLIHADYNFELVNRKVSTIRLPAFESKFTHIASEPTNSTDRQILIPLPNKIQSKLVDIVFKLWNEIYKWFFVNEDSLLISENYFDVRDILSWRSTGVIDRMETARGLIRNETLNTKHRFLFACEYYFEEDAQKLWTNMSKLDRLQFGIKWENYEGMRHWLSALENRTALDWEQISLNIMGNEFFIPNRKGIPYYLTKLQDRDTRYECIVTCLELNLLRPFDLYICLHPLKADELNDVFTRLPKDTMHNLFESFLQWPLQIVFLDMVNSFETHINGDIFLSLICVLLDKLEIGWEDYEYVDLLKNFWKALSSEYCSYIEQHEILHEIVKFILDIPVSFNVEDCVNFISNEREKRIKEVDGTVRKFREIFDPWKFEILDQ